MTRSPLFYPLNRGMDSDAGGVSDLQTDVMRFMAILSLCLVAIFALVQSIPLAPQKETPTRVQEPGTEVQAGLQEEAPPVVEDAPLVQQQIELIRPQPQKLPREEAPPVLERPRAVAVEKINTPPIARAPVKEGFTLRFENEQALTRLVARNEVGLYAILPGNAYRMNVNRGDFSFWPASMPNRFHEMDERTVPASVSSAFNRSNTTRASGLKWGVTIPSQTSRQLERILREKNGGDLVIYADGSLRLE